MKGRPTPGSPAQDEIYSRYKLLHKGIWLPLGTVTLPPDPHPRESPCLMVGAFTLSGRAGQAADLRQEAIHQHPGSCR
jgi:hypothetical protein